MMDVSVAICTWNRARLLDQTLEEIANLQVPSGIAWELLVVNNNCKDDTDEVVHKYRGALPIRLLHETQPGQSYARNCALAVARGELIVWTDDDVLVDRQWLAAYVNAAHEWPDAGYFAGVIIPRFEAPPPKWIEANLPHLKGPLLILNYGGGTRRLETEECPFGANMAFRREKTAGLLFDVRIGHQADKMFGGEDANFVDQVKERDHFGVWVGGAVVQHWVPVKRITTEYLRQWCEDAGASEARQAFGKEFPQWLGVPRWCVRQYALSSLGLLRACLRRDAAWVAPYMRQRRMGAMLREWRRLSSNERRAADAIVPAA